MAKSLSKAPSSLQLAYVESESENANPFVDLSGMLSKRCGSRIIGHAPESGELNVEEGKHVVSISLPPLADGEAGTSRKSTLMHHGE